MGRDDPNSPAMPSAGEPRNRHQLIHDPELVVGIHSHLGMAPAERLHGRGRNAVQEDLHSPHEVEIVAELPGRLWGWHAILEIEGARLVSTRSGVVISGGIGVL